MQSTVLHSWTAFYQISKKNTLRLKGASEGHLVVSPVQSTAKLELKSRLVYAYFIRTLKSLKGQTELWRGVCRVTLTINVLIVSTHRR